MNSTINVFLIDDEFPPNAEFIENEGSDINYELAFYREAPYSVRNYGNESEEL